MLLVSKYSCTFSTPRNKKNEKGYCLDSIHLVQHNVRMLILATNMFRNELLNLAVRYQYVILHIIAKVVLNQGNKLKSSCVLLSRIETCIDHVQEIRLNLSSQSLNFEIGNAFDINRRNECTMFRHFPGITRSNQIDTLVFLHFNLSVTLCQSALEVLQLGIRCLNCFFCRAYFGICILECLFGIIENLLNFFESFLPDLQNRSCFCQFLLLTGESRNNSISFFSSSKE